MTKDHYLPLYHKNLLVPLDVMVKNGVFWDLTPRGSYKHRRFGGT
jgi:hypothetical protein